MTQAHIPSHKVFIRLLGSYEITVMASSYQARKYAYFLKLCLGRRTI